MGKYTLYYYVGVTLLWATFLQEIVKADEYRVGAAVIIMLLIFILAEIIQITKRNDGK